MLLVVADALYAEIIGINDSKEISNTNTKDALRLITRLYPRSTRE